MSHAEIGRELGIPCQTVSSSLQHLHECENKENIPHPGHPRKTSQSSDRYLVCVVEADTHQPLRELHNMMDLGISIQTIEDDYMNWVFRNGVLKNVPS